MANLRRATRCRLEDRHLRSPDEPVAEIVPNTQPTPSLRSVVGCSAGFRGRAATRFARRQRDRIPASQPDFLQTQQLTAQRVSFSNPCLSTSEGVLSLPLLLTLFPRLQNFSTFRLDVGRRSAGL